MNNKILVLDDEREIAEVIALYLRNEGYEVELAFTGREALRKVEAEAPVLALLDVMLPDMDGFLLAQKIKEHQSDCLFLFVSNQTGAVFDAFQLPAFRFLPKAHLQERLEEAFLSAISQIKTIHSQYYVIQSGTALERVPYYIYCS